MSPAPLPIGLHLTLAARSVSRAFDDALIKAGGSLPVWRVLLNLKARRANQRQVAEVMGISEATLTHHLNHMEREGLIIRRRDPANRRVHLVELTSTGDELFLRLRSAAVAFDRRLRRGISDEETGQLRGVLTRLVANAGGG
jgi:MarR family transcriptional regulator for hemolysin